MHQFFVYLHKLFTIFEISIQDEEVEADVDEDYCM